VDGSAAGVEALGAVFFARRHFVASGLSRGLVGRSMGLDGSFFWL